MLIMEFNVKLQNLRKQKNLTQEELAQALYVSRTAVSKWESGRGLPNIDSLKAIARFFDVTVDDLLSQDTPSALDKPADKHREAVQCQMAWGLLDCAAILFFILPLFGQKTEQTVQSVSLFGLTGINGFLRAACLAFAAVTVLWGVLSLALQNCRRDLWARHHNTVSLLLGGAGVLLFIAVRQPYAAAMALAFLLAKLFLLLKIR